MSPKISPAELDQVGQHFYRFVEFHIEQLERGYLLETPEMPFAHYCFQLFLEHYRNVHAITNNRN
jgi:hypothetical protein